jgi:hypothetical protein
VNDTGFKRSEKYNFFFKSQVSEKRASINLKILYSFLNVMTIVLVFSGCYSKYYILVDLHNANLNLKDRNAKSRGQEVWFLPGDEGRICS